MNLKKSLDPLTILDWVGRALTLAELVKLARKIAPRAFHEWTIFQIIVRYVVVPRGRGLYLRRAFLFPWTRKWKRLLPLYPIASLDFFLGHYERWLTSLHRGFREQSKHEFYPLTFTVKVGGQSDTYKAKFPEGFMLVMWWMSDNLLPIMTSKPLWKRARFQP